MKKIILALIATFTFTAGVALSAHSVSADATNCSTWWANSTTASAQCLSSYSGGSHPLNQVSVKLICWNGPYRWTGFGPYVNVASVSSVSCPNGWSTLSKSYVLR